MPKDIQKQSGNEDKWRLTGKNLKFLQNLVKGLKGPEAHKLAGYSGNTQASYALKTKLKTQLAKLFEVEGISRDNYLAQLVGLLDLPCVDQKGGALKAVSLDQRLAILKLLKEELPGCSRPVNISSFTIHRYADAPVSGRFSKVDQASKNGHGSSVAKDTIIDISPLDVQSSNDKAKS